MKIYASDLKAGDRFDLAELLDRMNLSCSRSTRRLADSGLLEARGVRLGEPHWINPNWNVKVYGEGFDISMDPCWLVEVKEVAR